MRVLILHQASSEEAAAQERDVLLQRDAVHAALLGLGHEPASLACTLNLEELRQSLFSIKPDVVFNLVESLGGSDQLIVTLPMLLEALGIPYTGVNAQGLLLTSGKILAKQLLSEASLPTPPWVEAHSNSQVDLSRLVWPCRWIRKPIYEHASLGMTDDAVIACASAQEVAARIREWEARLDRPCFAEHYIAGREFNLSLLAERNGVEVLPVAEIKFLDFPTDKPQIVGFAAKWSEDATEFHRTPRTFEFPADDNVLLDRLRELALACWGRFQLRGYCRVDFRVDDSGQPWILEINANPCLTPDSGFAAALARAGIGYEAGIARIIDAATCWSSSEQ